MSRLGRSIAHALVRLYPATWRRRYEGELHDLVDDGDAGIRDAVDVAAGAASQHLREGATMRFEPAVRHPHAFALLAALVIAPTAAVVVVSLIGHELGVTAVATLTDPLVAALDSAPRVVDLGLVLAPLLAFGLAALPLFDARVERGNGGDRPALAVRIHAVGLNLVICAVAAIIGAALVGHILVESVLQVGA